MKTKVPGKGFSELDPRPAACYKCTLSDPTLVYQALQLLGWADPLTSDRHVPPCGSETEHWSSRDAGEAPESIQSHFRREPPSTRHLDLAAEYIRPPYPCFPSLWKEGARWCQFFLLWALWERPQAQLFPNAYRELRPDLGSARLSSCWKGEERCCDRFGEGGHRRGLTGECQGPTGLLSPHPISGDLPGSPDEDPATH